ncbi:MAG: response regulator [Actinobacteria bacterium]|nr:response regulator [Actinomycetota bacterium]
MESKPKILIVEDESAHAEALSEGLSRSGYDCTIVTTGLKAVELLAKQTYDLVITDLILGSDIDGLAVLQAAKQHSPSTEVILITAHASVATCREALRDGAYDYVTKPIDIEGLRDVVSRALERGHLIRDNRLLRQMLNEHFGFEGIVGQSQAMMDIISTVRQVAPSDITVLIQGESGTGKELIARALHTNSHRRNKRFVALNCAGLNESVLESELFGHVKGAFTGATTDRRGRFEHANGGTLLLDEVGDTSSAMQAKLLRVLEGGEVTPVGSNESINVDVRLISATNHDLVVAAAEKKFRQDLYFRLKGVSISLPPLRDRREDIPLLVAHFLKEFAAKHDKSITGLDTDVRRVLAAYPWPGNVRQLRNVIEGMVVLARGERLELEDVPDEIRHFAPRPVALLTSDRQSSSTEVATTANEISAGMSIAVAEKQLIRKTLDFTNGNREQAAKMLGIGARTLYRKLKEYDLS